MAEIANVSRASVHRSDDHVVVVQRSYFDSLFFEICLFYFFSKESGEYFFDDTTYAQVEQTKRPLCVFCRVAVA